MAEKKFSLIAVLKSDIKQFEKGFGKAGKSLNKFGKGAKKSIASFAKGIGIAGAAIAAAAAAMGKFAAIADKQIQAETQLNTVLKSTAGAANLTAKELKGAASELQNLTTFSDEDILKDVSSNLLTFTSIAGNEFKDAQKIILDMSTMLGSDLKGASIQVGKALNDPIKGVAALSKVGVSFTQSQKDVIKSLVDTGDVAGAQKIILAELNKEFGGQAEAAAKAGLGGWKQIKNTLGDIGEQIGFGIMPFANKLAQWIKEFIPIAVQGFTYIVNKVIDVYNEFGDLYNRSESFKKVIEGIKAVFKGLWLVMKTNLKIIGEGFLQLKNLIIAVFDPKIKVKTVWENFKNSLGDIKNDAIEQGKIIGESYADGIKNGVAKKAKQFAGVMSFGSGVEEVNEFGHGTTETVDLAKKGVKVEPLIIPFKLDIPIQKIKHTFKSIVATVGNFVKQNEQIINNVFESLSGAVQAFSDIFAAAKAKELSAAGHNAKKRLEIEKRYARKEQALAIGQAIINGALAFTKALTLTPPMNFIMASLTAASSAAQVSLIAAQKFATGGIVGGQSYTGDKIPALLNSREMVLNGGQQKNLFDMINRNQFGGGGNVEFKIRGNELVGVLNNNQRKNNSF